MSNCHISVTIRLREGGNDCNREILLPRNVAEQAIAALREISSLFVPALLVSEMRTVRADDLWLSPAYHRDSVVIHFTWTSNESVMLPVLGAIEERLMPLDLDRTGASSPQ